MLRNLRSRKKRAAALFEKSSAEKADPLTRTSWLQPLARLKTIRTKRKGASSQRPPVKAQRLSQKIKDVQSQGSKASSKVAASPNDAPSVGSLPVLLPKVSQSRYVRISSLPGDINEDDLRSWLAHLKPPQESGDHESSVQATRAEDSSPILEQFHMARDGENTQVTATFTKLPAIFDEAETNIVIEDFGKPWNDAVADTHFEGITIAYAPPDNSKIEADIVAVCDLGGHALGSWSKPQSHHVWLRDFLPKDIKHHIRILLYGYNATIALDAKDWKKQFHSIAISMLDSLKGIRDEKARGRPIIFLGHGLGGLVIEEALVITAFDHNENEGFRDIYDSSTGSLFFGVPHEGIRYWEFLEPVKGRYCESFMTNLQTDEETESPELLEILRRRFKQFLKEKEKKFQVVCYWEEDCTPVPEKCLEPGQSQTEKLFVSKNSATGVGVELGPLEALGIDGDHNSMVKFKTRNDEGYKSVLKNINKMVKDRRHVGFTPDINVKGAYRIISKIPDAKLQACIDTLYFREMNYREQEIQVAEMDSYTWILEHESYTKWTANGSGILGICGKPGSGKSTVMKAIQSSQGNENVQLSFFYHRRGAAIQHSQIGMYKTLLHQLLSQLPNAGGEFWNLAEEKVKFQGTVGEDWNWCLEDLRNAFSTTLVSASRLQNLRIFVDALDEAEDEVAQDVILYLRDLNEQLLLSAAHVSICFSCRQFPVVLVGKGYEVSIEDCNKDGVSMYISSELQQRLDFVDIPASKEKVLQNLSTKILEKASGVFLWAVLVVPLVARQWNDGESLPVIYQKLNEIPPSLDGLYRHILTELVDRSRLDRTLHLIRWILLSERPLSVAELRFALALNDASLSPGVTQCEDSKDFVEGDARMKKHIDILTGGLAEAVRRPVDDGNDELTTVQFIHQSVSDFLMAEKLNCLQIHPVTYESEIGEGHHQLAHTCIKYLKLERHRLEALSQLPQKILPFLEYSVAFLFSHARKAQDHGVSQEDLIAQFEWPRNEVIRFWVDANYALHQQGRDQRCPYRGSTLLHIASSWDLKDTVLELLRHGAQVEETDDKKNTAMHYAARWGCESTLRALLASGAMPDARNLLRQSPLINAAEAGHESIVRVLLNIGTDIHADIRHSDTPLQAPADRGSEMIVRLLLDAGANPNEKGDYFESSLQTPITGGSEITVQLLLNARANLKSQGGHHTKTLQANAAGGSEVVIRLFLDVRADPNAQGGRFGNALQAAAARGSEAIVQLLLNSGANPNARGGYFGNALQAAVFRGNPKVVKLLLNAGADVNAQGGRHRSSLQASVVSPFTSEKMVQLLLDAGAKIGATGEDYENLFKEAMEETKNPSEAKIKLLIGAETQVADDGEKNKVIDD